jgi:hypothetical protein
MSVDGSRTADRAKLPSDEDLPEHPPCPFCDSEDTKLLSPFGGQMSVAQYWCKGCRTGFEYIKWG